MTRNNIIKPKRLEPGDTLGLISPSGPVARRNEKSDSIPDHLEKGLEYLRNLGFKYILGKHALKRRGYLAGTDRERLEDLHDMFGNKKIDGIFCLAGGYGTTRLLPYMDFDLIQKNPKYFEGYSDITGLINTIHHQTGLVTFHGPMVNYDFGRKNDFIKGNLWKMTLNPEPAGEIPHPFKGPKLKTIYPGRATGRLMGGNLSVLVATLGSPYEPDLSDTILFLEDVDEEPYRFDRMLNHLLLTGQLDRVNGIIIGESVDCIPHPPDKPSLTIMEILDDLIAPLKKPAFYGLCCGHGKYKLTLPIGVLATIDATQCKLFIEESAVV